MQNGIIEPGTERGMNFGFNNDLFRGYLWKEDNRILLSLVISLDEGKGNLSRLFDAIEHLGYEIAVPTPMGKMKEILLHKKFVSFIEHDNRMGAVEVWMRQKSQ
jgi:hypothetical protein